MRRALIVLAALIAVGSAAYWWLTRPDPLPADALAGLSGDAGRGERVFLAAGCASCHVGPETEVEGDGPPLLAGGQRFTTGFGTFLAPNISPGPEGVGDWSDAEIVDAMMRGVSPDGAHYYPALPYAAYIHADPADMLDLVAYLRTLPVADTPSQPHEVAFPFNIRRNVGLWKRLYLTPDWVMEEPGTAEIERGRMLVEGLAHCGECHTPRDALGGLERDAWLHGAANPSGDGRIPGIDPTHLDWSRSDIAAYLTTGLTPDYDSAGGEMVAVIDKLGQLPDEDIDAITAYLKALPGGASGE
ncbi:mono/diheme cytochrome c family protein [Palleronia aestuarii]|uniref:Mono/diheme cytochrome c family protein n=1 Tax=Palleronia aestuarii TaxID=568105 RepID=A0A2W7QDJ8_9RHOB|nr:cytochrome c [Palleronia aestuarii]PZX19939.1 mono/diheme cytochrome c family protein [Palleronia aestuarii]